EAAAEQEVGDLDPAQVAVAEHAGRMARDVESRTSQRLPEVDGHVQRPGEEPAGEKRPGHRTAPACRVRCAAALPAAAPGPTLDVAAPPTRSSKWLGANHDEIPGLVAIARHTSSGVLGTSMSAWTRRWPDGSVCTLMSSP